MGALDMGGASMQVSSRQSNHCHTHHTYIWRGTVFDVPKTIRIKNRIFVEKVYTSAVEKLDQSIDFQAAMEITTNLQLEGMPDKDKAQVFIQSNV